MDIYYRETSKRQKLSFGDLPDGVSDDYNDYCCILLYLWISWYTLDGSGVYTYAHTHTHIIHTHTEIAVVWRFARECICVSVHTGTNTYHNIYIHVRDYFSACHFSCAIYVCRNYQICFLFDISIFSFVHVIDKNIWYTDNFGAPCISFVILQLIVKQYMKYLSDIHFLYLINLTRYIIMIYSVILL